MGEIETSPPILPDPDEVIGNIRTASHKDY